jgi:dihydroorotase
VVDLPAPTLAMGAPANLAVLDLAARWRVGESGFQSRSSNSAFLGEELTGQVTMTIAGGQVAWRR